MPGMTTRWFLFLGSAMIALGANSAVAQITPDGTLPNNSIVTPDGNTLNITGGTQAGSNLFHSFQQFSVPTGGTAFFNNGTDIQNIISRVTGGSVSNIDGIIRALGNANLFLINPSGIIFGRNASLNIGGSFVATTANAIQFGERGFFSASAPNNPELLTVNPSAFFFNQIAASPIQNNSVAPAGRDPAGLNAFGLRVPDGKSLLLLGGNVSMDGGRLNANGGRVELGGLSEPGTVALGVNGDNLSLRFPENVARASVSLTNQAGIYVERAGGGNIAVNARILEILGGSILNGGIGLGLGTPETVAGDITLNATGEIKVAGGSRVENQVRLGSLGNGGNVTIDSGSFSLLNGAQLSASTFGQGNAGNVRVNAKDSVAGNGNASILSRVEAGGVGKGGNIDINAATLSLIDGVQLVTATRRASNTQPAGQGDAGNVNIKVTGEVDIAGKKNGFFSAVISSVETGTVGNGGNITIDSGSLSLRDGGGLQSSNVSGIGRAGNITIKARDLVLFNNGFARSSLLKGGRGRAGNISITTDGSVRVTGIPSNVADQRGGQLVSATFGEGDAGNITIKAGNNVEFDGRGSDVYTLVALDKGVGNAGNIIIDSRTLSVLNGARLISSTENQGNAGNITITAQDTIKVDGMSNGSPSQIATGVNPGATGNGGQLNLNTEAVLITNDAFVNVGSNKNENGAAGNIKVEAGSIRLDNKARIIADTVGGQGNINLNVRDFLLLRRGSNIITDAAGENVIGGNINIDTDFLVAVENSDISANSEDSRGGNVRITAQGIFGTQFRDAPSLKSDITATGVSREFNGNVELITPGVDLSRGLVPLTTDVVDVASLVDDNVCARTANSSFTYTGRGGLPPSPNNTLNSDAVWEDWRLTAVPRGRGGEREKGREGERERGREGEKSRNYNFVNRSAVEIVEAQGWVVDANGDVILVAHVPAVTPHKVGSLPLGCQPPIAK